MRNAKWRLRWVPSICLFFSVCVAVPAFSAEPYRCAAIVASREAGTVTIVAFEQKGADGKFSMAELPQIIWHAVSSRPDIDFGVGYRALSYTKIGAESGGHITIGLPKEVWAKRHVSVEVVPSGGRAIQFTGGMIEYGFDEGDPLFAEVIFDVRTGEGQRVLNAVRAGKSLTVNVLTSGRLFSVAKVQPVNIPEVEQMLVTAKGKIDARSPDACTNAAPPIIDHRLHN